MTEALTVSAPRRLAKRLALAVDRIQPPEDGIVVLAYHRVGATTASPSDLPTSLFRRQLEYVSARADVLTLDEGLGVLLGVQPAAQRTVLTFDEGTADFVETALPILVELNLPATLYVTTGPIDGGRRFPDGGRPVSWNALRDALSTGLVDVGAHTHTTVHLDRRSRLELDLELDVCNSRIEDELGVMARHFAYPEALAGSMDAADAVRRRYRSAAVAGTRPNVPGQVDPWHLQRSPIQVSDGWAGFVRKIEGGMRADDLRRLMTTVRNRKKAA